MAYIIKKLGTFVNGTRTATVEHVTHVNAGIPKLPYYSVTGVDSADPSWEYIPPGFDSCEKAICAAEKWVTE